MSQILMRITFFKLVTIFLLISLSSLSCGQLTTARYKGLGDFTPQGESDSPQEFSTPSEIYSSEELKTPHKHQPTGPFKLQWPVRKLELSRGFNSSGKNSHMGLDIPGRKFDPIYAAHDGIVVYAGSSFRGYGNMIILEFDDSWASLYGHLARFNVKTGQTVKAGNTIGLMGRTGRASGVHLHFELMKNKIPIDPLPLLTTQESVAKY